MSAYLSNISNLLTQTTSKYNSIRRALISSDADGDTEDDSHISRVLRAYYTEKGRPFPAWLPPDPHAPPPPAPTQFVSSSQQTAGQSPWGSSSSQSLPSQQPLGGGGGGGGRWASSNRPGGSGLSDLWDAPRQPSPQEAGSLRPRMGGRAGKSFDSVGGRSSGESGRFAAAPGYGQQAQQEGASSVASLASSGAERLKARLLGGRAASPTPSAGSPPPAESAGYGGRPSWGSASGGGGGGGGGGPSWGGGGGGGGTNPYAGGGGGSGYGSGSGGGLQRPAPRDGRIGLPSGPRMKR